MTIARRLYDRFLSSRIHSLFYRELIRKTNDFSSIKWLGETMMQNPLDAWVIQETIAELKPELLIECGTYKGGSSLFYAHLFDLIGHGSVITIDVRKLHDLNHSRVTYLIGSSTSDSIVGVVRSRATACRGPILVILDSDHSASHVQRELECYAPFVTPGSYCLVQDAIIDTMSIFRHWRPGPLSAIEAFLAANKNFELDDERENRYLVTNQYKGWLKRTSDPAERPAAQ